MNYFVLLSLDNLVYSTAMDEFDVIIIGSGIIGSMCAWTLSTSGLSTALLEAEYDVAFGISSRNSGVLHSGIHYTPGSLRAIHAVRGNHLAKGLCRDLGVPLLETGKLTTAFDESQLTELYRLKAQGEANGVKGLEILSNQQARRIQRGVGGIAALYSPSTAVVEPYGLAIACARSAYERNVRFFFGHRVTRIDRQEGGFKVTVTTEDGVRNFSSKTIVDAAGLGATDLIEHVGISPIPIHPCRGEYLVLDKRLGKELSTLVYPVPGHHSSGLGIHLTMTPSGNILVGPSNEYIEHKGDLATTEEVLSALKREAGHLLPGLTASDVIRSFSGIRPKRTPPERGGFDDFIIEDHDRFILLAGIESPGLTASPSIALEVASLLKRHLEFELSPQKDSSATCNGHFLELSPARQEQLLATDPAYGRIVCRCEGITEAELLQAVRQIFGPVTYTGIKLRCRAMMGRCQGGFCLPRIAELLERHFGMRLDEHRYKAPSSPLFDGHVREKR